METEASEVEAWSKESVRRGRKGRLGPDPVRSPKSYSKVRHVSIYHCDGKPFQGLLTEVYQLNTLRVTHPSCWPQITFVKRTSNYTENPLYP